MFLRFVRWSSRVALMLLLFGVIGEIVVRVHEKYRPFMDGREIIPIEMSKSMERQMVRDGTLSIRASDVRVLVLGDSFMQGAGLLSKSDKFSNVLRRHLKAMEDRPGDVYVLDASSASNNTANNFATFQYYFDTFQPTHVIIGYNLNDITGNVAAGMRHIDHAESKSQSNGTSPTPALRERTVWRVMGDAIYESKLLKHVSHTVQNTLKADYGIVLSGSGFDYYTRSVYQPDNAQWLATQDAFSRMANQVELGQSKLYIYMLPEFHLIEHPQLFSRCNEELSNLFSQLPSTELFRGDVEFAGDSSEELCVSKYDGHPNAKAHKEMADGVFRRIREDLRLRNQ
jgi:lysophospholipase L1-like esterase